jgi:hypothetical protein
MPNNNASLDVRNFASNEPGWTNVQAPNGQTYSYAYSGGTDGVGGYETRVGNGVQTINVNVAADPRYDIQGVTFPGDIQNQLTWHGSARAGVITDVNTQAEQAHYCVTITDTQANTTFNCDPMISNDPRGPTAQIRHM